jgi:hypothetical protein
MTTGPQSEWGRRADAVLRELFASLPIDTPEAEVRRRVTAAYPWGRARVARPAGDPRAVALGAGGGDRAAPRP